MATTSVYFFMITPFSTTLLHCFTVSHGVWGNDQVCYEYPPPIHCSRWVVLIFAVSPLKYHNVLWQLHPVFATRTFVYLGPLLLIINVGLRTNNQLQETIMHLVNLRPFFTSFSAEHVVERCGGVWYKHILKITTEIKTIIIFLLSYNTPQRASCRYLSWVLWRTFHDDVIKWKKKIPLLTLCVGNSKVTG